MVMKTIKIVNAIEVLLQQFCTIDGQFQMVKNSIILFKQYLASQLDLLFTKANSP